jgi:hypothetical protein
MHQFKNRMEMTKEKSSVCNQVWWNIPVIPALGRLRQQEYNFKATVGYIARLCQKQNRIK